MLSNNFTKYRNENGDNRGIWGENLVQIKAQLYQRRKRIMVTQKHCTLNNTLEKNTNLRVEN